MPNKNSNGGYMMILMLLMGVAIVAFLMMKNFSLLQSGKNNPNNTSDVSDIPEQATGNNLSPIDSAKNVKDLIEKDNLRAIKELN